MTPSHSLMFSIQCLVALLPVCSGLLATSWEELQANHAYSFADYVAEFEKNYDTEEYMTRKLIFEKQLHTIRTHNAERHSWKLGLNQFSDWEEAEVKEKMTGLRSAQPKPMGEVGSEHKLPPNFHLSDLPASIDWRKVTPSVVTSVKTQAACGSCWAFANVQTIESAVAIASGKLYELSAQQLVSCTPNPDECGGAGGCLGATCPIGFNYSVGAGLTLEASYPYTASDEACDSNRIQPVAGIKGFLQIPKNNATLLMHALTAGPVAIGAAAEGVWMAYEGGVWNGVQPGGRPCGFEVNHGVVVEGYGNDEESGLNYWIIRNSWSQRWGEKGYMRLLRAADGEDEPCGMSYKVAEGFACKGDSTPQEYCGTCGVLSQSSYPTGAFSVSKGSVVV